jgi:hypothetical protein
MTRIKQVPRFLINVGTRVTMGWETLLRRARMRETVDADVCDETFIDTYKGTVEEVISVSPTSWRVRIRWEDSCATEVHVLERSLRRTLEIARGWRLNAREWCLGWLDPTPPIDTVVHRCRRDRTGVRLLTSVDEQLF